MILDFENWLAVSMNPDCIFCDIVAHRLKSTILYETDDLIVIPDIMPKAPVHLQVIPKEHIQSAYHLDDAHKALVGSMVLAAKKMAQEKGVGESGYKLVFNVGKEGGQIIPHLHMHVLGGKQLAE